MLSIELTNANPWRPADWRWLRATGLAAGEIRRNRQHDDRHVRHLERFALAVAGDDPEVLDRVAMQDPALFWAWQLSRQEELARRAEVEARILANEPAHMIASKTGIPEATILAYEWAFYDVRDKLPFKGYVLHTLIGTALHRGLQERDYPLVWKYLAYTFGTHVFESFLYQAVQPSKPRDAHGVKACLIDAGFMAVLRKQMLAGTIIPLNQFTQAQVLDVYAKFVEIDRTSGAASNASSSSTLIANVQAVLNLIPLDIGPYSKPTVDAPLMSLYDASSEEMTTPRLIAAARGQLADDDGPTEFLQYPEPTNHVRTDTNSGTSPDSGSGSDDRSR